MRPVIVDDKRRMCEDPETRKYDKIRQIFLENIQNFKKNVEISRKLKHIDFVNKTTQSKKK